MPKPLWAPWRLEYVEHADELDRCIFCEPGAGAARPPRRARARRAEQVPVLVRPSARRAAPAPRRLRRAADDEALEIHRLGARGVEALRAEYAPHGHNLGWNLGRVAGAGIEDTCTCTSCRAGTATRTSCRCSATSRSCRRRSSAPRSACARISTSDGCCLPRGPPPPTCGDAAAPIPRPPSRG